MTWKYILCGNMSSQFNITYYFIMQVSTLQVLLLLLIPHHYAAGND